jgi:hypothetical protein
VLAAAILLVIVNGKLSILSPEGSRRRQKHRPRPRKGVRGGKISAGHNAAIGAEPF